MPDQSVEMLMEEIGELRDGLAKQLAKVVQWPEPAMTLNYADRRGSDVRMFKYLHQMCTMHSCNFRSANEIKHLYLIDGFLTLAMAENPIALYGIARTMLELNAYLFRINSDLNEVVARVNQHTWRQQGERFFKQIIRARFATNNPEYRQLMSKDGVSPRNLDPLNITHCIETLASQPENADAISRYSFLCDFVHHNLSSSTTANTGSAVADMARTSGGGGIISTKGPMPVTQYEYPARGKTGRALDHLAAGFLHDARACVEWIVTTPENPYPVRMIEAMTGSPLGAPVVYPHRN